MFTFNKKYFLLGVLLFVTEVLIALYLRGGIIRPYIGDYLVVIMLYCGVRTFLQVQPWKAALGVLLFAFAIEFLQYLHIVDRLGLRHNRIARTILGTGFDPIDLLLYAAGIGTVLLLEKAISYRSAKITSS